MVQADFIALCIYRNFHLIADMSESLFVVSHCFAHGLRNFGFNGQLKGFAPPHP